MSNLFVFPRQRSIPYAKLAFRVSGTSTPQPTYQDIDLQVAHADPVVADADGYFAKIYLDPSLPNYRVIHTDTNDVQLEPTQDDIPAAQLESQTYRLKGTAPELVFEETDASADNGRWRIRVQSEILSIDGGNDAESAWTPLLSVPRGGIIQSSGSFTVTLTGVTTTVQGTAYWTRDAGRVTIEFPMLQGTSNSTSKAYTGIPVGLRPIRNYRQLVTGTDSTDTVNYAVMEASINTPDSSVSIRRLTGGFSGPWTNTGSCTINGFVMQWLVA